MNARMIDDRTSWNDVLRTLPAQHVLQTWEWGEVKSGHGWHPTRLLWERAGEPVAAAQVLRRPLPHTPWSVMYVSKGPSLDYEDRGLLESVLGDLEGYARRRRAIFIKIDPDVDAPAVGGDAAPPLSPTTQALVARGWRSSAQQIQFRNTALIDLTLSEDDLLAAMKSKTRYNVRLAERRGVAIEVGTVQDIPAFYRMYAATGARDGFLIRPLAYYRDAWQTFMEAGLGTMLLARVRDDEGGASRGQQETVAGLILFSFGDKAWYMYGASTEQHRQRMPNYALQWAAIRWAKSTGYAVYDLWGAPDTLDESDRMWGVWRFKEGLGARFAPHIGAYDYPTSRLLYWAYAVAVPRYLRLLRRRSREEG